MSYEVMVKPNMSPFQVDGFGKDLKRSRPDSLHFHPSRHYKLTDDEWEFIKSKKLSNRFVVYTHEKDKEEKKVLKDVEKPKVEESAPVELPKAKKKKEKQI